MKLSQGDIIKVCFDPSLGHEQAGYRPACIVSNRVLNNHSNIHYCCPITNTKRMDIFCHQLNGYPQFKGYVLCDQINSLDLNARPYKLIGKLKEDDITIILDKISMVLEKE